MKRRDAVFLFIFFKTPEAQPNYGLPFTGECNHNTRAGWCFVSVTQTKRGGVETVALCVAAPYVIGVCDCFPESDSRFWILNIPSMLFTFHDATATDTVPA